MNNVLYMASRTHLEATENHLYRLDFRSNSHLSGVHVPVSIIGIEIATIKKASILIGQCRSLDFKCTVHNLF